MTFLFLIKEKKYLVSPGVITVQRGSKAQKGTFGLRSRWWGCPGLETLIWFWPPEQPLWAGPASALASPAPSRCPSALRLQAAESQRRPIWEGAPNTEWAARFSDQAQGFCWKTLGTSVLIAHLMEEAKGGERLVTQWVNLRAGTRTQMLTPRLGGLLLLQDTICFLQGWPISSFPHPPPHHPPHHHVVGVMV